MIWAILSDIHGRNDRLARVLLDARTQGAQRYLSLGDVGSTTALDMLADAGAMCVFGNWEASGLRGMPYPYRGMVARWPAHHREGGVWAGHASPVWPDGLAIVGVVDYLRAHGLHWLTLFPPLQRSEAAREAALTTLAAAAANVFFHGHTHIQEAWLRRPDATWARLGGTDCVIEDDSSGYLIGVGSVGDPHDGVGACYVLYDDVTRRVIWRRV